MSTSTKHLDNTHSPSKNHENYESFGPQKFYTIWYVYDLYVAS